MVLFVLKKKDYLYSVPRLMFPVVEWLSNDFDILHPWSFKLGGFICHALLICKSRLDMVQFIWREERHKNVSVVPILYNHLGHSVSQEDKKCVRKRTLVRRTLK